MVQRQRGCVTTPQLFWTAMWSCEQTVLPGAPQQAFELDRFHTLCAVAAALTARGRGNLGPAVLPKRQHHLQQHLGMRRERLRAALQQLHGTCIGK